MLCEKAEEESDKKAEDGQISFLETKQLFIFNTLPFVGFGILDNAIMILAGRFCCLAVVRLRLFHFDF